jgi:hypothetical protein
MSITGELQSQIDRIWNDMYAYSIPNLLVIIEQLFDDLMDRYFENEI